MSEEELREKASPDPALAAALVGQPDPPRTASALSASRQAVGRLDAQTCRGHALQCAVMALAAELPREKQLFTRLFQAWTNLAIDIEREPPT
jgi:hypothetical protein